MRAPSIVAAACLLAGNAAAQTAPPPVTELPPVEVVGASPLIGSGVDRNTVPAETHVLDSNDLRREGTPDLVNSLNALQVGVRDQIEILQAIKQAGAIKADVVVGH